jgi:hypothetical protein
MFKRMIVLSVLACVTALGQSASSLRGIIKDTSGAVIADSVVTLTDTATSTSRKVLSDGTGAYQFL